MGDATVNYPELGGVETKRTFYAEGTMIAHPSGAVYERINGTEDGPER